MPQVSSWQLCGSSFLAPQDARTKLVNEVLQGIRVIKFFAWCAIDCGLVFGTVNSVVKLLAGREDSFREKVGQVREEEMTTLRKSAYLRVSSISSLLLRFSHHAHPRFVLTRRLAASSGSLRLFWCPSSHSRCIQFSIIRYDRLPKLKLAEI